MNFEQLQYVITIAEQNSITKAANLLYLSQSALTKSMNRLEDELGVKLFDRLSTPIHLTAAGAYFVKQSRVILEEKDRLENGLQKFTDQHKGTLRVGMGPGRAEYWSPFILSRFWKLYPNIQVDIVTDSMLALEEKLLNKEVDVCIVSPSVSADPGISYYEICRERLLFVIPRGMECLRGYRIPKDSFDKPLVIRPETLNGQPFVTSKEGFSITRDLENILARHNIVPSSVMHMMSIDAAYIMATEGERISYVYDICKFQGGYYKTPVFCVLEDDEEVCVFQAAVRREDEIPFMEKEFIRITKEAVRQIKKTNEI